jgi:hypothetical protein
MPVLHVLLAVEHPLVTVPVGARLHVGGIRSVLRLGDAEGEPARTLEQLRHPLRLLLLAAVMEHQQQADVVADDRRLVLQVVVEPEPPAGEVLPDHGHAEVGAVLAAVLLRERVPVMAGDVSPPTHLGEQRLPVFVRQAAPVPVRPGVLTPVVEEPLVVVLGLERLDLPLDEVVQLAEVVDEVLREVEVHGVSGGRRATRPRRWSADGSGAKIRPHEDDDPRSGRIYAS